MGLVEYLLETKNVNHHLINLLFIESIQHIILRDSIGFCCFVNIN